MLEGAEVSNAILFFAAIEEPSGDFTGSFEGVSIEFQASTKAKGPSKGLCGTLVSSNSRFTMLTSISVQRFDNKALCFIIV